VFNRDNANGNANGWDARALASAGQLWRANTLGVLELREAPAEPISREVMKELLAAAVREGLWQPETRAGKA
jgi:hypothetical protein